MFSWSTNKYYIIDLDELTCDCADFGSKRQERNKYDIKRFCEHLSLYLITEENLRFLSLQNSIILYAVNYKKAIPENSDLYINTFGKNESLIIHDKDSEWLDVFAGDEGEMERYGFSIVENRWAYDDKPPKANYLKDFIKGLNISPVLLEKSENKNFVNPKLLDSFVHAPNLTICSKYDRDSSKYDHDPSNSLFNNIINELFIEENIFLVEKVLLKLENIEGLPKYLIAREWIKFHKLLQLKGHDKCEYFFQKAKGLDRSCSVQVGISAIKNLKLQENIITTLKELEFLERRSINNEIMSEIQINEEKLKFNLLELTEEKQKALRILNTELPQWYDHSKNHTFLGYEYADLVRSLKSYTQNDFSLESTDTIADYFASLAIQDGTISENVMADLLKMKGFLMLKRGNKNKALVFFQSAVKLNKTIGLKKKIKELKDALSQQ